MRVSITVTIEAGARTPLNVIARPGGINNRVMKTMGGRVFTEDSASQWIVENLSQAIINNEIGLHKID